MKHLYTFIAAALLTMPAMSQLVDSDFSTWNGNVPAGWVGTRTNLPASAITQVDNNGGFGTSAVRLVRTESGHQRFTTQPLSVENTTVYTITFWARGNGEVRTGIYDNRTEGFGFFYNPYVTLNSMNWTEYTQTIEALNTFNEAEFIFSVRNTSGNHVQIDRAVITSGNGGNTAQPATIFEIQFTNNPTGASPLVGTLVATGGIVTAVWPGQGFYIQNNPGPWQGVFVFSNQSVQMGDSVTFNANVVEFFEMTQLSGLDAFAIVSSGNALPAPVLVPTAAANAEQYEGVLVKVQSATCTDPNSGFGQLIVNDGSGPVLINRSIYNFTATLNAVYDITGPAHFSFGEYKILPRTAADVSVVTSAQQASLAHFNVYPVPARDRVWIDFSPSGTPMALYRIFDVQGQEVQSGTLNSAAQAIEVAQLPAGVYSLQLSSGELRTARKIVVAK